MALELITAPNFRNIEGLIQAFTTRRGGVSEGAYDSLNFGYSSGDESDSVTRNHELLCEGLGISFDQLASSRLTHGKECILVDLNTDLEELSVASADILMTREPGIFLLIRVADCYPVVIVDEKKRLLANIHAGWRGTLAGIVPYAIDLMKEKLGSRPEDMQIAIGPGIGLDHFEVSQGVANLFKETMRIDRSEIVEKETSSYLDLSAINVRQACEAGVPKSKIWVSQMCTYADKKRFYSYRRDGKNSGRMASVVGWRR